jgi:hypothetical protein
MDDNFKHPPDEKKVKLRMNLLGPNKDRNLWILLIIIVSFALSASLNLLSSNVLEGANIYVAFGLVLVIIIVNIIFDIIGTAVTAADEAPFHSMASRKLYGAKQSIKLIRNADKVSNFCNDVIGDICGVISGSASALIVLSLARVPKSPDASQSVMLGVLITGLVAALTVGGKAMGKFIAIEKSNYIIYKVGVIVKFISENNIFSNIRRIKKKRKKK